MPELSAGRGRRYPVAFLLAPPAKKPTPKGGLAARTHLLDVGSAPSRDVVVADRRIVAIQNAEGPLVALALLLDLGQELLTEDAVATVAKHAPVVLRETFVLKRVN